MRLFLAEACESLGDEDSAQAERTLAREALERLGIATPLDRIAFRERRGAHGLTAREGTILAMVATGKTNREIAQDLGLSIRSVERHLATVYQELGLHGRSARAVSVSIALRGGMLGQ